MPLTSTFSDEIVAFRALLAKQHPFALARVSDASMRVLQGLAVDLRKRGNGEFQYKPGRDERLREYLRLACTHDCPGYYVGAPCPCCVGQHNFAWTQLQLGLPHERITWATLWSNANYTYFRECIIPEFRKYPVALVCHERAKIEGLPFRVEQCWRVGSDAWRRHKSTLTDVLKYLDSGVKNRLFLFACGPLANLLTRALWTTSRENTYLSIGAALDPYLFAGKAGQTREYLGSGPSVRHVCRWNYTPAEQLLAVGA